MQATKQREKTPLSMLPGRDSPLVGREVNTRVTTSRPLPESQQSDEATMLVLLDLGPEKG